MDVLSPRSLDEWTFVDDNAEVVGGRQEASNEIDQTRDDVSMTTAATDNTVQDDTVPDGYMRIRLRMGEQVRLAHFKATQIVEDFTAEFFADALADRKRVRLIYMGMLLMQDRTMGEYGIEAGGVIHAVITDAPPSPHPEASRDVELKGLSNPANSLLVTTGFILYGLWTLLYHFPHMFSWKSIILLAVLSIVHVSATVSRLST